MAPDSEPRPRVPWLPVNEGEQKAAPATPQPIAAELLTPTQPTVPAWIQREQTEEPSAPDATDEADEPDESHLNPAVEVPPAEELLPSFDDLPGAAAHEAEAVTAPMPRLWSSDPVQLLGESAVASAALSASGAPTPLGGVPTGPVDGAVTPPSFGPDAPLFTPKFAQVEPDAEPTNTERADALAAGIAAYEQQKLVSKGADLDGGVAYAPITFGEPDAEPTRRGMPADGLPADAVLTGAVLADPHLAVPPAATAVPPRGPKKRRWWLWLLLALLVVAAVAVVAAVLHKPDPTVVPGVVVTQPPPSPTIDPIAAPTATAFQSAMPTTVGQYSLVEATPLDPADIALTAGRVADGVDLVYRSGDGVMKVRALQYYSEDDASAMFTKYVGEAAATQPVEAGGTTVGESAIVTSPKPGIVWRNGTSLFIVTGPPLQLTDFYAQFGL